MHCRWNASFTVLCSKRVHREIEAMSFLILSSAFFKNYICLCLILASLIFVHAFFISVFPFTCKIDVLNFSRTFHERSLVLFLQLTKLTKLTELLWVFPYRISMLSS